MQRALLIKALLIGAVFLALMVPLRMIDGIVAERAARQQAVVQEIMLSSYGRQIFAGPVLSIPYFEEYDETVKRDVKTEGEEVKETRETKVERRYIERKLYFFPTKSQLASDAVVSEKKRGLFRTRVFEWKAALEGEFVLAGVTAIERTRTDSKITWGKPSVGIGISDLRGLNGSPKLRWAGSEMTLQRGSALQNLPNGLHADVPEFDPSKPQAFIFALTIDLRGAESLAIVPLAENNKVKLTSAWPHPSFGGQLLPLPESQEVTKDGFSAEWNSSGFASNAQQQMLAILKGKSECSQGGCPDRIEVRFVEPIDIYSLSDRALKYGFLFIGLTFACLVLFEVLKKLPIHPAQYLLGGLALATFFLLLISLSEHLDFGLAYLIASSACITLLGYYLVGVLRSTKRGILLSAMLVALYSALYGLLISEDNALLLGSLLIFGILAIAMVTTRRLDWYALVLKNPSPDMAETD
jgi:inner membrane protein